MIMRLLFELTFGCAGESTALLQHSVYILNQRIAVRPREVQRLQSEISFQLFKSHVFLIVLMLYRLYTAPHADLLQHAFLC